MKRFPPLSVGRYRGQWLALDPRTRKVVGHGPTVAAARKAATRNGVPNPVFHGVPESDAYFVGHLPPLRR